MRVAPLVVVLLPFIASCHPGELLTAPVSCTSRTDTPTVIVGPGVQPVIDWTPRCTVSEIWIEALADSASPVIIMQWGRFSDFTSIRPPIQAKIDYMLTGGPEEIFLTVGVRYKACLVDNERYPGYWAYLTCTEFTP